MATALGAWGEEYEVADAPVVEETPAAAATEVNVTDTQEPAADVPAAADTDTSEPAAAAPQPTTIEVIKEVEKVVEKYPEMSEYTREIFDALQSGDEEKLLSYLSEKHRDYKTMSDYDVVKEQLARSNPKWDKEALDLKMESKYGEKLVRLDMSDYDKELNPDEYNEAVRHNKEVERNEKLLKLDAIDARIALDEGKKSISLPKINTAVTDVPAQPTEAETKALLEAWNKSVDEAIPGLSEFKFKADDEDVVYKVTDAERKEQAEFMKTLTPGTLAVKLGWVDKDGMQDIAKIAGDVLKIAKMDKLIASAYTQGKTAGTKNTVAEIKNLDLNKNSAGSVQSTPPDIGMAVWGHINPK